MDRHIGFNCSGHVLLRSVLAEKQELCFSVVSLLWHKQIVLPETQPSAESTSAQQGWRQVVAALCNVVSSKSSDGYCTSGPDFVLLAIYHRTKIVTSLLFALSILYNLFSHFPGCCQAERELKPWIVTSQ